MVTFTRDYNFIQLNLSWSGGKKFIKARNKK